MESLTKYMCSKCLRVTSHNSWDCCEGAGLIMVQYTSARGYEVTKYGYTNENLPVSVQRRVDYDLNLWGFSFVMIKKLNEPRYGGLSWIPIPSEKLTIGQINLLEKNKSIIHKYIKC